MVHSSLKDLLKALKGLVVMSQALETMFNSLYNNTVPELWAAKVRGRHTQLELQLDLHTEAEEMENLLSQHIS